MSRHLGTRGFTLSEAVIAMAFIGVITTSMLIIASKGFQLSNKETDMAAAYQSCESILEDYATKGQRSETSWSTISTTTTPQFTSHKDKDDNIVFDRRFVYKVTVTNVGTELKKVQVSVFRATSATAPTIDTSKPRGGEVYRLTNFYPKPANASETSGG